ncbi:uncharacterized protein LOC144581647 [Callithrix jacchus]
MWVKHLEQAHSSNALQTLKVNVEKGLGPSSISKLFSPSYHSSHMTMAMPPTARTRRRGSGATCCVLEAAACGTVVGLAAVFQALPAQLFQARLEEEVKESSPVKLLANQRRVD